MVSKIDLLSESVSTQPKRISPSPAGDLFQASLKNALSTAGTSGASESETPAASALGEPQAVYLPPQTEEEAEVASQTEKLIGLLEAYAAGLENPNATLKELEPLVTRIQDEAAQLMTSADSSAINQDLSSIAAQTAVTAAVEYIKFQRGDYV